MKRLILTALVLCSTAAFGQTGTTANSTADAVSNSDASSQSGIMTNEMGQGAYMQMGNITFGDSIMPDKQRIHTTPNVYMAPSMFGGSNNCGKSNTLGVGVTGFGIGGSVASESVACNAREDTATAYRLGFREVAVVRFFCFGEAENRLAYEAAGHSCPDLDMIASRAAGAPAAAPASGAQTVPVQEPRTPVPNEPAPGANTSRGYPGVDVAAVVVAGPVDLSRDIHGTVVQSAVRELAAPAVEVVASRAIKLAVKASGPVGSIRITETEVLAAAPDAASPVVTLDVTDPAHPTRNMDPEQLLALAADQ
ncbi:hypothetical protein LKR43_04815 [Pusillimonas sp. MFBS29]|uniref:hypothetical protein n=1 Tax=Pusillimonas sp. MFBS29 TaxID=2886690 RepID=UPI001D116AB5|nr:hypothetical protein [Pusillimonas sp. MFBS29]MCC2595658.1 hypothetical protein [Pusillimonas sp. MFBS29]